MLQSCLSVTFFPALSSNFSPHPKSKVVFNDVAAQGWFVIGTSFTLMGFWSNSIKPKKLLPPRSGCMPGWEFIPMINGELVVGSVVVVDVSGWNTMVFPLCVGVLHDHLGSSTRNDGSCWSDCPPRLPSSLHRVFGGIAMTMQFHAMSLIGLGSVFAGFCGPKQIAIPIHNVIVGTKYILIIDEYGHTGTFGAQKKLSVNHLIGNQKIPGAGRYHHAGVGRFPGMVINGIPCPNDCDNHNSGCVRHHMIW